MRASFRTIRKGTKSHLSGIISKPQTQPATVLSKHSYQVAPSSYTLVKFENDNISSTHSFNFNADELIDKFIGKVNSMPLSTATEAFLKEKFKTTNAIYWQEIPNSQLLYSNTLKMHNDHCTGIVGACYFQRSLLRIPQNSSHSAFSSSIDGKIASHNASLLLFPLYDWRNALCAIAEVVSENGEFTQDDEVFAHWFANKFKLLSKWFKQPFINDASLHELMALHEQDEFVKLITKKLCETFDCRDFEIWSYQHKTDTMTKFGVNVPVTDSGIVGDSLSRGQTINVISNRLNSCFNPKIDGEAEESVLSIPVTERENEMVHSVVLRGSNHVLFTKDDEDSLKKMAPFILLAYANAKEYSSSSNDFKSANDEQENTNYQNESLINHIISKYESQPSFYIQLGKADDLIKNNNINSYEQQKSFTIDQQSGEGKTIKNESYSSNNEDVRANFIIVQSEIEGEIENYLAPNEKESYQIPVKFELNDEDKKTVTSINCFAMDFRGVGHLKELFYFFSLWNLLEQYKITNERFLRFLLTIRKTYTTTSYHNWTHACDVTQYITYELKLSNADRRLTADEIFVLLVSGVCHDANHRGLNNVYNVKAKTPLGILFKDTSVMEMHHLTVSIPIISQDNINLFGAFDDEKVKDIWTLFISLILSTDMAKHFDLVKKGQALTSNNEFDWENPEHKLLVLQILIKIADISNVSRPFKYADLWCDILNQEFFHQGDLEKSSGIGLTSPLNDREHPDKPKSQIGFYNFVCLPLYDVAASILPPLKVNADSVRSNLEKWKELQQANAEKQGEGAN